MKGKTFFDEVDFSPIYVDANLFSSEKVRDLYRFAMGVFPQMMSQAVLAFRNSRQTLPKKLRMSEMERKELVQALKGISLHVKFSIKKDGMGEIMAIPFSMRPNTILGQLDTEKQNPSEFRAHVKELQEVLLPLVQNAIKQRLKEVMAKVLTLEALRPKVRVEIQNMIREGLITSEGKIVEGVELDRFLIEKYSSLFKQVDMEILKTAGMIK